ncbi:MAG TPA: tetratricopeptide repeat protein [Candidatus Melainabacteria bacterium]|nr:tetratricopeptide repeat protein [Candidatus Melainabacteria bacterium]
MTVHAPKSFCADGVRPVKESVSECMSRAVANEKSGRMNAVIKDANRVIELEPKNWRAYELRAKAYFKVGPYVRSISDYRSAIALAPREARLREDLLHVIETAGETDLMVEETTNAINSGMKNSFLYIKRADAYYRQELYEKAAADLTVLMSMPVAKDRWKRWEFLKLRGLCYLRTKQLAKAEKDCSDALVIANDDSKTYFCRADVRERMGKYREAVDDLTKTIKLDPGNGRAFSVRAKIYEYLGDKKRADADRKEAIEVGQKQWGF